MPFWTISLTGGPKRANQAATALGWRIYSFGEFDPQMEESNSDEIFGVHVLNTECYRWYQLLGSSKSSIYLPALLYDKVFKHRLKINQLSGDKNDEKNDYENDSDTDDDINNEERRSALIETPGNRTGHTVVTYEGKIYMWGGFIAQFELCSKLYCFDPEMKTWSVIPCNGETPPGRARHTAVVYNDMMIIYGGREDHFNGLPTTISAYDFKNRLWYQMLIEGELPVGREFHTACIIRNKMYVFGGNDALKNDLCLEILNFETCRWENPIISGDQPCGRRSHCCWVYNDKMYIFGGYQHTRRQHLNTLHEFNPETSRWRYLELNGLRCPIARQRHCAVVVNNRVFLFGGLTPVIHWSVPIDVECLVEICDLHVLSYELKLKDLCVIALQKNKPNDEILNMLPYDLRFDLRMMTTTNPVS